MHLVVVQMLGVQLALNFAGLSCLGVKLWFCTDDV